MLTAAVLVGAASGAAQVMGGNAYETMAPIELERQCAAKDANACGFLGERLFEGRGVARDSRRAVGLLADACDAGSPQHCYRLGDAYRLGEGVGANQKRATALYSRACERGHSPACTQTSAAAPARADAASLAVAAGADVPPAYRAGVAYERGEGAPADKARAVAYYAEACDGGYMAACFATARLFERGEGVPRNDARASALFAKACDGGDADACFHLGVKFASGEGVGANSPRAAQLLARACANGQKAACGPVADVAARARPARATGGLGREYGDAPEGFADAGFTAAQKAPLVQSAWKYFEDYRASLELSPPPVKRREGLPVYRSVANSRTTLVELQYFTGSGTSAARSYRQAIRFVDGRPVCLFTSELGRSGDCIIPDPPLVVQMAELKRKYGRGVGTMSALLPCIRVDTVRIPGTSYRPIIGNEPNTAPIYGAWRTTPDTFSSTEVFICPSRTVSVQCLKGGYDFSLEQERTITSFGWSSARAQIDYFDGKISAGECVRTR